MPGVRYGSWCGDTKARYDREYIPLRLPRQMMGGDPDLTLLPPVTPYQPNGGAPADVLILGLGADVLPRAARSVIHDAGDILTGAVDEPSIPSLDLGASLDVAFDTAAGSGIPQAADQILASLPLLQQAPQLVLGGGSPVVPLLRLRVAPDVQTGEVLVQHRFDIPAGSAGEFMASTDNGLTWKLLPLRGAPGVVGSSGPGLHLGVLDVGQFRGSTVLLGARIAGDSWASASWSLQRLVAIPAGAAGFAPQVLSASAANPDLTFGAASTPGQIAALAGTATAHKRVLVGAPLVIPADATLTFQHVDLLLGDCGGRSCPVQVLGTLTLDDVAIHPVNAALQLPTLTVLGQLLASDCRVGGLLSGLTALGGRVELHRCWVIGGAVGALSLLGSLEATDSVFSGQALGAYALGSQVRLQNNLFVREARAAGLFDESWGTVRDNVVLHTKQAGFLVRSPLGGGDLALLDNDVRETGTAIGATLDLEDRVLALDPRDLGVPVAARDRVQGNRVQWASLEGVNAGALSDPVLYGNSLTHDNIGVKVGMLDSATINANDIYSNINAWREAILRGRANNGGGLPGRATPAQDGNLWTGLWQGFGLGLPTDATGNYWGPGPIEPGTLWPSDVLLTSSQVDLGSPSNASVAASAPYKVVLTAPGYGGGLLPRLAVPDPNGVLHDLAAGDLVSPLSSGDVAGTVANATQMVQRLTDRVRVVGFANRTVPMAYDVPAGVTGFTVRATFHASGLRDVFNATTLLGLQNGLGALLPLKVPDTSAVTRSFTQHVTATGTHGTLGFQFDGVREAFADWEVVSYDTAGHPDTVPATTATKAVRVHNALVWPLLLDVVPLVSDLAYGVLGVANGTVQAIPHQELAATLPLDPASLAGAGLPQSFLPDGTLALDGTPSLATLAHSQAPVRTYEFRYSLSSEPGAPTHALEGGFAMGRALPLPTIPDGATLRLEARATDASGLTGPWVSVQLLQDRTAPSLQLGTACLPSTASTVAFHAADAAPAGRPSGVGTVQLVATALKADGSLDLARTYVYVQHGTGPAATLDGTWQVPFPPEALAGAYALTGAVQDRAGNVALASGAFALDVSPPAILAGTALTNLQALLTNVDPQLGVPNPNLGLSAINNALGVAGGAAGPLNLVLGATVSDPGGSCGLASVDVESLGADGVWRTIVHHDVPAGQTSYMLPATDVVDLAPLDGHTVDIRIVATDRAGHSSTWDTGAITVDLRAPSIELPALLPCLPGAATAPWAAHEAPGAVVSGLRQARLTTTRPDASQVNVTLALTPGQLDASASYTLPFIGAGTYTLAADASDLADNALAPTAQATVKVDTALPAITLQAQLALLQPNGILPASLLSSDHKLGSVQALVDDSIATTCGLASAILDSSSDGTTWTTHDQKSFTDGTASTTLSASADLTSLDGKRVTFRVRGTDAAGNTALDASKANILVDLSKPLLPTPPTIPAFMGTTGFTVAWSAADDASHGEASGIATQSWKLHPQGQPSTVIASGDATHLTVRAPNPTANDGATLTFRLDLTDRAGNVATWTANTVMDARAPSVPMPSAPVLDVARQAVVFAWTAATDPGSNPSGVDHYIVTRDATPPGGPTTTTQFTVPGNQTSVSDDAASLGLAGKTVRYYVSAVDRAGNGGTRVSPNSIYVNFVAPTVGYSAPAPFGRTQAKGTEIDTPYTGVVDLGAAIGATTTVVSAQARPGSLLVSLQAVHTDPNVVSTLALTLDGAAVSPSSSTTNAWTYNYALGAASTDTLHTLVAKVTGNNGLTSQQSFRFYVPSEASLVAADEQANSKWTLGSGASFDTASGDRLAGTRSVLVNAGAAATYATWSTDNPSPRLAVSAQVRLDRAPTGAFELLAALDQSAVRSAVLVDGSRALSVQTPAGAVATGVTLGTGWQDVRLVLSPTLADLYVGGHLVGTYAAATPSVGLTGVRFGGVGGKEIVDSLLVHALSLQLASNLQSYMPIEGIDGWTVTGSGTLATTSEPGVGTALKVQGGSGEARSPSVTAGQLAHAVLHFRMDSAVGDATQAFRLVDAAGNAVVTGTVVDNQLRLSDGPGTQTFGNATYDDWHRVDLYLEGPTYIATLDQGQTLLAATGTVATVDHLAAGLGGVTTLLDALRVAGDGPEHDTTFAQWPDAHNWHPTDPASQLSRSGVSNMDPFSMSVNVLTANNQPAYLWTDKTGVGSRYVAEVAYRPVDATFPPVHQAVLAAFKADGTVGWSITMADDGTGFATALYYNAPGGAQTKLVGGITDPHFHAVRVVADEAAQTLKVLHDEATVLDLTGAALPVTTKLAVGDVFATLSGMTGAGQAYYDDLSLFPN
ncbi:MAG: hypothetical protein ABR586_08240 [Thermoplasmatota archaeon]